MARMRIKPRPSDLLASLRKREDDTTADLEARLRRARVAVSQRIRDAAERRAMAASAKARNRVYDDVGGIYEAQAAAIDEWMQDQVGKTAAEWARQAVADVKRAGGRADLLRFSRERVRRYWEIVNPDNDKHLAAVMTEKMAPAAKRQLRGAFLDTFRQQVVEGWTAKQTAKTLQEKWDKAADDVRADRFTDAGGRVWTNAQYIQMLTRTTLQKASREAYVDGLTENGYTLARISDDGDPCPACQAWAGVVVDITNGRAPEYPPLQAAYDSGWGHPNCMCRLEYMDDTVDGAELERQAEAATPPPPKDWGDREAVKAYRERVLDYNDGIRLDEKRAAGMTEEEAERDLTRDRMKALTRGAFPDDEGRQAWVDRIPDDVLDRMDRRALPRIEPAKREDVPNSSRDSSAGGVLYLARDGAPEAYVAAMEGLQEKREGSPTPTAPTSTEPDATKRVKVTVTGPPVPQSPAPSPSTPTPVKFGTLNEAQAAAQELIAQPGGKPYPKDANGKDMVVYRHRGRSADDVREKVFGTVRFTKSMTPKAASAVVNTLGQVQRECDRVGVPRLRGVYPDASATMAMGDGLLAIRGSDASKSLAGWFKQRQWDFGDSPDRRPRVSTDLFAPEDQVSALVWHETGHHMAQQYGVTDVKTYRNPPLDAEIKAAWLASGKGAKSSTLRSEQDHHEWFAENYALAKMGRINLVDKSTTLRDILKRVGGLP